MTTHGNQISRRGPFYLAQRRPHSPFTKDGAGKAKNEPLPFIGSSDATSFVKKAVLTFWKGLDFFSSVPLAANDPVTSRYYKFKLDELTVSAKDILEKNGVRFYEDTDLISRLREELSIAGNDENKLGEVGKKLKILTEFVTVAKAKNELAELFRKTSHLEVRKGSYPVLISYLPNTDGQFSSAPNEYSTVSAEDLNSAHFQQTARDWLKDHPEERTSLKRFVKWITDKSEISLIYGINANVASLKNVNVNWLVALRHARTFVGELTRPYYTFSADIMKKFSPAISALQADWHTLQMIDSMYAHGPEQIPENMGKYLVSQLKKLNGELAQLDETALTGNPRLAALLAGGHGSSPGLFTRDNIQHLISSGNSVQLANKLVRSFIGGRKTVEEVGGQTAYYNNQDINGCLDQCHGNEIAKVNLAVEGEIPRLLRLVGEETYRKKNWLREAALVVYKARLLKIRDELAGELIFKKDSGKISQREWERSALSLVNISYMESVAPTVSYGEVAKLFNGEWVRFPEFSRSSFNVKEAVLSELKILKEVRNEFKKTGHGSWNLFYGDYHISTAALDFLIGEYTDVLAKADKEPKQAAAKYGQIKRSPLAAKIASNFEAMQEGEFYRHLLVGGVITLATLPVALGVGAGTELALGAYSTTLLGRGLVLGSEGAAFVAGESLLAGGLLNEALLPGDGALENISLYSERLALSTLGLGVFKRTSLMTEKFVQRGLFGLKKRMLGLTVADSELSLADILQVAQTTPGPLGRLGLGLVKALLNHGSTYAAFTLFDIATGTYQHLKDGDRIDSFLYAAKDATSSKAFLQRVYTTAALVAGGVFAKPIVRPLQARVMQARLGEKFPEYEQRMSAFRMEAERYGEVMDRALAGNEVPELRAQSKKLVATAGRYLDYLKTLHAEFPGLIDYPTLLIEEAGLKNFENAHKNVEAWFSVVGEGNSYGVRPVMMNETGDIIFIYSVDKLEELQNGLRAIFGDGTVKLEDSSKITLDIGGAKVFFSPIKQNNMAATADVLGKPRHNQPEQIVNKLEQTTDAIVAELREVVVLVRAIALPENEAEWQARGDDVARQFEPLLERLFVLLEKTMGSNESSMVVRKYSPKLVESLTWIELSDRRHAVNNILSAAIGYGDLIRANSRELKRGDNVPKSPRDFVKLVNVLINLNPNFSGGFDLFKRMGRSANVRVSVTERCLAKAPLPRWLKTATVNFVTNAGKYAKPGTKTALEIDYDPETGVVSFKDNGPGIPESIRNEIGKARTRADETKPGSGEGLLNVYKIAEKVGGQVWFETSDKGTTFFVRLPEPLRMWGNYSEAIREQVQAATGKTNEEIVEIVGKWQQ